MNAYIMAAFVFQFGFLQPVVVLTDSQLPMVAFTGGLFAVGLVNSKFRVRRHVLWILAITSIYFAGCLILSSYTDVLVGLYAGFLAKGSLALVIGSLTVTSRDLFDAFAQVSLLNFAVLLGSLKCGLIHPDSYMRYGYGMIPSAIMFCYVALRTKRWKMLWLVMAAIALIVTLFYGSRGPLVVFLLWFCLLLTCTHRISLRRKMTIVIPLSIAVFLAHWYNVISSVLDLVYHRLGIRTYSIEKLMLMVSVGIAESSSGRDNLYRSMWQLFRQNVFFGNGLGATQANVGYTGHNLILQILVESGLLGLLIWTFVWFFCAHKYTRMSVEQPDLFLIATLMMATALGRLLVSSDLWLRPEYWFCISLLIGSPERNRQGCRCD